MLRPPLLTITLEQLCLQIWHLICIDLEIIWAKIYTQIVWNRLAGQPLRKKRERVWSTSHYCFLNVSHYFLGVWNHSNAHQRKYARALHVHAACTSIVAVWRGPARTTQKNVTIYHNQHVITGHTLHCLTAADPATKNQWCEVDQQTLFLWGSWPVRLSKECLLVGPC